MSLDDIKAGLLALDDPGDRVEYLNTLDIPDKPHVLLALLNYPETREVFREAMTWVAERLSETARSQAPCNRPLRRAVTDQWRQFLAHPEHALRPKYPSSFKVQHGEDTAFPYEDMENAYKHSPWETARLYFIRSTGENAAEAFIRFVRAEGSADVIARVEQHFEACVPCPDCGENIPADAWERHRIGHERGEQ